MAFSNAAAARVQTNIVRGNLNHINELIDAEVAKGGESIGVGPTILTEQMITSLRNKGYIVSTRQDSMGSYKEYKISW
jgi:hypothetical protein